MTGQQSLFAPDFGGLPPEWHSPNRAICVPGVGSRYNAWSCMMIDAMPDLGFLGSGTQVFPYLRYSESGECSPNITRRTLERFADACGREVSPLEVFYWLYGFLHIPAYAERWHDDLFRALPRVPIAVTEFDRTVKIGERLADLHCCYEGVEPVALGVESADGEPLSDSDFLLTKRGLFWEDSGKSKLRLGPRLRIHIPSGWDDYRVGDQAPLEWVMRYYRWRRDPKSGIVNDANAAPARPRALIALLGRMVAVARAHRRLVERLPVAPWQDQATCLIRPEVSE